MNCKIRGENLEGDGNKKVLHCPNANEELINFAEPDANPIYCEIKE